MHTANIVVLAVVFAALTLGGFSLLPTSPSQLPEKALSPTAFNLPSSAKEVVSLRTQNTATFEISPKHFVAVSGIAQSPNQEVKAQSALNVFSVPQALAASVGANSPAAITNDFTGDGFDNPDNAKLSDGNYATVTDACLSDSERPGPPCAGGYTYAGYLEATDFGFNVPANATITGIVPEVKGHYSQLGTWFLDDNYLMVGGNLTGGCSFGTDFGTSDAYDTLGSSDTTCNASLSVSDVNASDFGFALLYLTMSPTTSTVYVDHMRMTVYYTVQ